MGEHPVVGGLLRFQSNRLRRGCKNLMAGLSPAFKPAWSIKLKGAYSEG